MDKKNDTAKIIGIMAGLAALDVTGVSAAIVLVIAAAIVIKRELCP